MLTANIFENIKSNNPDELFEDIISNPKIKLERIVSNGQSSPEGYWYDQEKDEWVILLKGSAGIKFESDEKIVELKQGDYLLIPAHCKHRVDWTDKSEATVWLALHF